MEIYNIFSIIVLFGVILNFIKKRKTIFCISNIVNIIFFIIFVIAPRVVGFNNIIYNEPLLYSLICSYIVLFLSLYKNVSIQRSSLIINTERFLSTKNLLNIYMVFFISVIIYHILVGDYSRILSSNIGANRLETYYDNDFNLGSIILGYVKMFFYVTASIAEKNKKNNRKILLIFLLIAIEVAATSQHRTPVITPIILGFVFYHLFIRRIRVGYFLALGIGVILFMSIGSYIRSGQISDYQYKGFSGEMAQGLRGLNTSESFDDMQRWMSNGNKDFELGYQFFLDLITPIPRIIWKEKPNVSFSSRMTEEMYGTIGIGNWVRTFTVWGEGYSQFGYIGVILYSYLLVFILRKFISFLSRYKGMEIVLINFIIQLPFLIRADLFAVFTRILFIILFLLIIHLFIGIKREDSDSSVYQTLIQ